PGRAGERGDTRHPLARPRAVGGQPTRSPGRCGGRVVTLGELSQRLRRVDFLDGLGIYVGAHEVALAHVVKRFFTVALRHARTYPLPPATHPGERRQALGQAVLALRGSTTWTRGAPTSACRAPRPRATAFSCRRARGRTWRRCP